MFKTTGAFFVYGLVVGILAYWAWNKYSTPKI